MAAAMGNNSPALLTPFMLSMRYFQQFRASSLPMSVWVNPCAPALEISRIVESSFGGWWLNDSKGNAHVRQQVFSIFIRGMADSKNHKFFAESREQMLATRPRFSQRYANSQRPFSRRSSL